MFPKIQNGGENEKGLVISVDYWQTIAEFC